MVYVTGGRVDKKVNFYLTKFYFILNLIIKGGGISVGSSLLLEMSLKRRYK